jgi:plasmid stabilization system protein ParE
MTSYTLVVTSEAERNIASIYDWIAARSQQGAASWYENLLRALDKLHTDPTRFSLATESKHFPVEVRQLIFRMRGGSSYRVLFTLTGDTIEVLFIRAPGQDLAIP